MGLPPPFNSQDMLSRTHPQQSDRISRLVAIPGIVINVSKTKCKVIHATLQVGPPSKPHSATDTKTALMAVMAVL